MGDKNRPVTQIKPEDRPSSEAQVKKQQGAAKPKPKVKVENAPTKPTSKQKSQANLENDAAAANHDSKGTQNIVNVANPLFGRAGSANIKEEDEDCDDTQTLKDPPKTRRAPSTKPKAVRLRKGKVVDTITEVTKQLKTKLEQDEGVVVDATMLTGDGAAVVSKSTSNTPQGVGTRHKSISND